MTGELVLVANAGDSTISAFTLDVTAGVLEPLATTPVGRSCSTFAVDAERELVYAATKGDADGVGQGVDCFHLDRRTGALELLGHVDGVGYHFLALAHGGTVLTGAAYHDGVATTWAVDGVGHISPAVSQVEWVHAHAVAPVGEHLYVASLGEDVIAQYALDVDGVLTPLDPAAVAAPEGSGPRHLTVDADGSHLYCLTEFSGEVISYVRDPHSGGLEEIGRTPAVAADRGLGHSRLGADPRDEHLIWGADIHLARGGRLALASERTESTLASLRIDDDGVAGEVVDIADTVRQPRGFAVTSDGRHAVVAGEAATEVMLLAIGADGSLRPLSRAETGAGANWVRTLAL